MNPQHTVLETVALPILSYACVCPFSGKEPFLFFAEFSEDHYVEALKRVFFIFAGIGGTNPRPTERATSPSGVPFPTQTHHTELAEQGRT